jgi:septal ring factor EnvC (AmiA/AmiB activator)
MPASIEFLLSLDDEGRANRLKQIDTEIDYHASIREMTRSDQGENGGYTRRHRDLTETITRLTNQLKDMEDRHNRADEIIDECNEEIESLKKERAILKNASALESLKDTLERMHDVSRDVAAVDGSGLPDRY